MEQIKPFLAHSDYVGYFKSCWHRFGVKAIYKQFRFHVRRRWSRNLIKKFAPTGYGIEIGSGYQTIAPVSRTVLTDAYLEHGADKIYAKLITRSENLPFSDSTFNFVLSEHVLEHLTDPIQNILEWKRVLKSQGIIFLFLPHPDRTFDRLRPKTTLEHLIADHNNKNIDGDATHYQEWKELVIDKGLAPHYASYSEDQTLNQGLLHRHVWTTKEIVELLEYCGMEVLFSEDLVPDRQDSFVVVARKS
ncbi:MAG: class I SAM-dependent methyltransferase [Bdellovibrio sp.]